MALLGEIHYAADLVAAGSGGVKLTERCSRLTSGICDSDIASVAS